MEGFVPFGSRPYSVLLLVLFFSRGMDFLSTWIATPNMVLEGNPVAKKLGWRWGIPFNIILCFAFAFWPLPAIVICTTSVLVAARNFQSAWLMHSMGEYRYREWHIERIEETSAALYVSCLFGNTLLTALVGVAIVIFCDYERHPVVAAIGLGIIAYAAAVAFYSGLGIWRLRRSAIREEQLRRRNAQMGIISPLDKERNGRPPGLDPSHGIQAPRK